MHNNDWYGLLCMYLSQSKIGLTEIQIMFVQREQVEELSDAKVLFSPTINGNVVS